MLKKLFSLFAALTLSVGLWAETVSYLYPVYKTDGVATSGIKEWQSTTVDATEITNKTATFILGTAGETSWYVVKGSNVTTQGLVCNGAVNIILADNVKLTATGANFPKGTCSIQVSGEGNSLAIYAQSTGEAMGQLIAKGGKNTAGIGGGKQGSGSNITINGGIVTARGGEYGAGIGGGEQASGSYITINGGIVTANGGENAAGIGGGKLGNGSNITINGGTVTANGEGDAAGIGGGHKGFGSNITINGGTVIATGGDNAAGIGGGYEDSGSDITINGGTITATGNYGAAGIGGGGNGGAGSNITINGGEVTATGGSNAAGIGGGYGESGSNITILAGTVTATGGDSGAGIGGGSAGFGSNITISGGKVTANGGSEAAGIGGGIYEDGSDITINGGEVTANGGVDAAGIGSGSYGAAASNIYISDAYILKAGASETLTDADIMAHSSATDLASTLTQQYVQFGGLATPYTRTVTANSWGTVCLPYAVTDFSGVTFYKVNYYNASENALYVEEVSALEAGKPYIFEATEDGTLTINHSATAPMAYSAVGNEGGLFGSLTRTTLAYDADHAYAAISGGSVVIVGEGNTVTVPACRAYLDMNEVATSEQPHNAPLRCMGAPRQQPTDNENVNADGNMNGKFVINGQFVIVKDGKKINALGF